MKFSKRLDLSKVTARTFISHKDYEEYDCNDKEIKTIATTPHTSLLQAACLIYEILLLRWILADRRGPSFPRTSGWSRSSCPGGSSEGEYAGGGNGGGACNDSTHFTKSRQMNNSTLSPTIDNVLIIQLKRSIRLGNQVRLLKMIHTIMLSIGNINKPL